MKPHERSLTKTRPSAVTILPKSSSPALTDTARIALLDSNGKIVAVNRAWLDLAVKTATPLERIGPGVNYLEVCRAAGSADAQNAIKGVRAVLQKNLQSFSMDYSAMLSAGTSHFRMTATPLSYARARVAVAHVDVTDLQRSRDGHFERLQQFAHRLIRSQEEERERISRELHDDFSNRIALLASMVRRAKGQNAKRQTVELDELMDAITGLSTALRDLSHLLHPPVLKYAGICAALTALCEEFGKNHAVQMDVEVPADRPNLPEEVELCIFRISQECLTNIYKHSGARRVSVVLKSTDREVRLKVSDTGRGFVPSDALQKGGLGLISMEERVLSLGGDLEVRSSPGAGTEIRVTLPTHKS